MQTATTASREMEDSTNEMSIVKKRKNGNSSVGGFVVTSCDSEIDRGEVAVGAMGASETDVQDDDGPEKCKQNGSVNRVTESLFHKHERPQKNHNCVNTKLNIVVMIINL